MGFINVADKTIHAKLVYYGVGMGGKTTSLQAVNGVLCPSNEVKLVSINTDEDATLLFDFLPINLGLVEGFQIMIQGFTVPGQPKYKLMRKYVLQGADAVVLVVDTQTSRLEENIQALEGLQSNLRLNGLQPDTIPLVMQYNKRDLDDILTEEELDKHFLCRDDVQAFPSVATENQGVFETFVHAAGLLVEAKINLYGLGKGEVDARGVAEAARKRLWEIYDQVRGNAEAAGDILAVDVPEVDCFDPGGPATDTATDTAADTATDTATDNTTGTTTDSAADTVTDSVADDIADDADATVDDAADDAVDDAADDNADTVGDDEEPTATQKESKKAGKKGRRKAGKRPDKKTTKKTGKKTTKKTGKKTRPPSGKAKDIDGDRLDLSADLHFSPHDGPLLGGKREIQLDLPDDADDLDFDDVEEEAGAVGDQAKADDLDDFDVADEVGDEIFSDEDLDVDLNIEDVVEPNYGVPAQFDEDSTLLDKAVQSNLQLAEAFGELDQYKAALERKNEELVKIAQNTVHDLNRPLSAIKLMLSSAVQGYLGEINRTLAAGIDNALIAVKQMERLLEDLMDSSRLDFDGIQLKFEQVDMTLLVAEVVRTLKTQIEEKDVGVRLEPLPVVMADEWALVKAFMNLLGNAIQYAPDDQPPRIRIYHEETEDHNVFMVEDNGIGIPEDSMHRLFKRFERGENTTGISGTGLGLHIVKEVVQGHGGFVEVESVEGEGSRFAVFLPKEPIQPPHCPVSEIKREGAKPITSGTDRQ
ncbi:MAG: ATP-binding protein [Planctomycetota bacterium]|jgi:signal transduction histidine kinase/signal recognition particle receptor subunit beta